MRSLFATVALLTLVRSATAQPDSLWAREWEILDAYTVCADLVVSCSNNYLLVGRGNSLEEGGKCLAINTDTTGEEIWRHSYGGERTPSHFTSVEQLTNGAYINVGDFTGDYNGGYVEYKPYAVIIDSVGHILWEKIWLEDFEYGGLGDVFATTDGGFIAGGSGEEEDAPVYLSDMIVSLVDSVGNIVWNKIFGVEDDDEHCNDVIQTLDGGFVVAGFSSRNGSDIMFVKLDGDGNEEWTKYYGGEDSEGGSTVRQFADGGYLIKGSTKSYGAGSRDIWLIRTDSEGNETWSQTYGGRGYDAATEMIMTPDSGFVIAGSLLLRIDDSGEELWHWAPYRLSHLESFNGVVRTPDGGYAAAGSSGTKWWLYKFGPDPIQPNRAPGAFELVAPEENFTVDTPDSALLFDWTAAADPDSDAVHYVLYLQHQHPDDSTRFQIDAHHSTSAREEIAVIMHITRLWPRFADTTVVFSWWVEASDGALTTPSLTRRTLFVPPPEGILDFGLRILDFGLGQPYPNPFNESVAVSFVLPFSSPVRLRVIDAGGREAAVLSEGFHSRGRYQLLWNARGLPAGTYLLRLDSRLARASRVVTLVK